MKQQTNGMNMQLLQGMNKEFELTVFDDCLVTNITGEEKNYLISTFQKVLEQTSKVLHQMCHHLNNQDYQALASATKEYQVSVTILQDPKFNQLIHKIEKESASRRNSARLLPLLKELSTVSECMQEELQSRLSSLSKS